MMWLNSIFRSHFDIADGSILKNNKHFIIFEINIKKELGILSEFIKWLHAFKIINEEGLFGETFKDYIISDIKLNLWSCAFTLIEFLILAIYYFANISFPDICEIELRISKLIFMSQSGFNGFAYRFRRNHNCVGIGQVSKAIKDKDDAFEFSVV